MYIVLENTYESRTRGGSTTFSNASTVGGTTRFQKRAWPEPGSHAPGIQPSKSVGIGIGSRLALIVPVDRSMSFISANRHGCSVHVVPVPSLVRIFGATNRS